MLNHLVLFWFLFYSMKIIDKKEYSVDLTNPFFSLGLKKNMATLEDNFITMKELHFSKQVSINVQEIQEIVNNDYSHSFHSYNAYQFKCVSQNGTTEYYYFSKDLLSKHSWSELFNDLSEINTDISFCSIAYKKKELLNQQPISIVEIIFLALILIPTILGVPSVTFFLGNEYFVYTIGEEYPIYKNILVVIGSLGITGAVLNGLSSLFHYYLGHKTTIMSGVGGMMFIITGVII